jgi:ribonuclease PH
MIFRSDQRALDQLRELTLTPEFIRTAEGSCLIELGNTRVICTATLEESVPHWMRNLGRGWVTSEYGMLPRAPRAKPPGASRADAPTKYSG